MEDIKQPSMDLLMKDDSTTAATMDDVKHIDKELKIHSVRKTQTMPERQRSQSIISWVRSDLARSSTYHSAQSKQRFYGGQDGFSCFEENDLEASVHSGAGDAIRDDEKQWDVKWDGQNDPQNPRSMTMARKWAIVLIMASSALCVYV